ncbi:GNAT family N-acetyltransferase, partial [Candidatus Bipolaricaulota bacterium]|nr:GNAT family N-acetyltransferase [Candidatus Bipolaricaulota bacterium]
MISLRPLTIDDYDGLRDLWQEAGLPYRPNGRDTRENISSQIEGECSIYLAAEENGQLVGAILGTHDGRKGWLNRMAVAPDHRKRGIAAMLVRAVE